MVPCEVSFHSSRSRWFGTSRRGTLRAVSAGFGRCIEVVARSLEKVPASAPATVTQLDAAAALPGQLGRCVYRSPVLRQHRLRRPVRFFLRLAEAGFAAGIPLPIQHPAGPKRAELVPTLTVSTKDGAKRTCSSSADFGRRLADYETSSARIYLSRSTTPSSKQSPAMGRWFQQAGRPCSVGFSKRVLSNGHLADADGGRQPHAQHW